jgi:hypothetical protein
MMLPSLIPPCRHIGCTGSDSCIRRPRRSRIRVDADNLDAILDRWGRQLSDEDRDAGHVLLHALLELERAGYIT